MKFVIRNKKTKEYVKSEDYDFTSFIYVQEADDATIFDNQDERELFFEHPDRLIFEIRPVVMKFSTKRDIERTEVESKIINQLNPMFHNVNESSSYEDIIKKLTPEFVDKNEDVKFWIKNNFKPKPKVGDMVCILKSPNGMIDTHGHCVTFVDDFRDFVKLDNEEKKYNFDMIVEDQDYDES